MDKQTIRTAINFKAANKINIAKKQISNKKLSLPKKLVVLLKI